MEGKGLKFIVISRNRNCRSSKGLTDKRLTLTLILEPPQRSVMKILPLLLLWIGLSSGAPLPEEQVTSSLYGIAVLPCQFTFVDTLTDLTVIWKKVDNQMEFILWKIQFGKEKPNEQDPRYRGRVELSKSIAQGGLQLTLRNVTYEDEGTYECRATNHENTGYKKMTLSITDLNAHPPTVTLVTIDGERHMKCQGSGDYHHPLVQWITSEGEDLSRYGRINIIEQSNGWKFVESVLDYNLEANVQVLCHIKEGRLKRSIRAIISDGTRSVVLDDTNNEAEILSHRRL